MEPKIPDVYFPVYTSNTGALTALYAGQIDWTGNFIPGPAEGLRRHQQGLPPLLGSTGQHQRLHAQPHQWPTNQLAVRQAISAAVNRTVLADEGEAGLENPVLNARPG